MAKNTAVRYTPSSGALAGEEVKINIVDTPGHADFGGEVERTLRMVDGIMLLVDAAEGRRSPRPGSSSRRRSRSGSNPSSSSTDIDRQDARPEEVLNEVYDLFIDLGADEHQIEFPVIYAVARDGQCTTELGAELTDLRPVFDAVVETVPAPQGDPDASLQVLGHRRQAGRLPRAHRDRPRRQRDAEAEAAGPPLRARRGAPAGHRHGPVRERGARARRGRGGPGRRGHPGRRAPGRRAGRVAGGRRGPAAARGPVGGRADALDGVPDQRQPVRRPRREVRDLAEPPRPADEGGRGQPLAPDRGDRLGRPLPRLRPRRAPDGDPHRADAARGLRVRRRDAAGDHEGGEGEAPRALRAGDDRRGRGVHGRRDRDAGDPARADGRDEEQRGRARPDDVRDPGARAHRLPDRVPHRHQGDRPPHAPLRRVPPVGRAHHAPRDRRHRLRPPGGP